MLPNCLTVLASVALWLLLDLLYPYHSGIWLRVHPVHTCYFMARRLHRPGGGYLRGVLIVVSCLLTHLAPYAAAYYLLAFLDGPAEDLLWALLTAWCLKVSASPTLLIKQVREVGKALAAGDIDGARAVAQGLVRRDLSRASSALTASAAIESLAESLVDGVVSPLTYFALLGPLGALTQRLVNTLDGAIGFKDQEHLREGAAAAYLDTLINYVPARLTAALILLASAIAGGNPAQGLRCWLRYRGVTESKNAGHPMSAMAGVLGVKLEKVGHYTIPCGELPGPRDVLAATKIGATATIAYTTIATATATITHAVWLITHP